MNTNHITLLSDLQIDVAFPVRRLLISFQMKEESSLDDIQVFMLQCIKKSYGLDSLCEITLFSETVIHQMLEQLASAGFIFQKDDFYVLTEIAERLLRYQDWLNEMTSLTNAFAMNMVTGEIFDFASRKLYSETDLPNIKSQFSSFDLESMNLAEDPAFVKEHFDFISSIDDTELELFLETIILSVKVEQEKCFWTAMKLTQLPEWPVKSEQKADNYILVRLFMNEIEYVINDTRFNGNEKLFDALKAVNEIDDSLISKKGKELLDAYENFNSVNNTKIVQVSPVTNAIRFVDAKTCDVSNEKPALELNIKIPDDDISLKVKEKVVLKDTEFLTQKGRYVVAYDIPLGLNAFVEAGDV